jgi:hypothetical protein
MLYRSNGTNVTDEAGIAVMVLDLYLGGTRLESPPEHGPS